MLALAQLYWLKLAIAAKMQVFPVLHDIESMQAEPFAEPEWDPCLSPATPPAVKDVAPPLEHAAECPQVLVRSPSFGPPPLAEVLAKASGLTADDAHALAHWLQQNAHTDILITPTEGPLYSVQWKR